MKIQKGAKPPVIAAIDVGTNSFHLVVASIDSRDMLNVVTRDREMVRLGSGAADMKYLQEDAIERGVAAIKNFVQIAKSEKAFIRAVATSAVREAFNRHIFIDRVREETGIDIEIVSGTEEGRLIYVGAMYAVPIYASKALVIDIGGGSTETIIGSKGELIHVNTEKIGAIRLTQRFFENGISNAESVKQCREYIRGEWSPELRTILETGYDIAVGCSGTIQAIAAMALSMNGEAVPDVLNGLTVNTADMLQAIETLVKAETPKARANLPGIESSRADIILAGALILEFFIKKLKIDKMLVSPYALREGIVYDTLQKIRDISEFKHLSHLRYETILNLCHKFQVEIPHAEHVKRMTLKIFDALASFHKLGNWEREMLEAAALLHDSGYMISHDQHHRHSYYLITHSDMPGFTNDEAEIIGNIARYHRKSHPKKKHIEFSSMHSQKQEVVKILSGILRLGEGIDRRRRQFVEDIEISVDGKKVKIKLIGSPDGIRPDIEVWGANRRVNLLEESLGIKITVH